MVAIPMLLYGQAIGSLDILWLGQHLLEIAAILTIWSMLYYLQKAWPTIKDSVGS
jgi:CDP-diacylglycerol--glycerol-3-phosphate 3-phosphatidyltransferase/cardiolipin synthase